MRLTVKSNKNPYAEGEAKSGVAIDRPKPNRNKVKTGLATKKKAEAAAKAKAGATGRPKPVRVSKPKPTGAPKGRAQKLARPGVKPKRAARVLSATPKNRR